MLSRTAALRFFFNDTATTEIYTLSLHDALPISDIRGKPRLSAGARALGLSLQLCDHDQHQHEADDAQGRHRGEDQRSEEHTSELQSRQYLVCRLLLEKKQKNICQMNHSTAYRGK